jgi:glutamine---fructose-6-phosphate transaminase (isomerizing)
MCGITGYIGKRNILTLILSSLQRMQNRGYDSAGIFYSCIKGKRTFFAKYASDDKESALSKLSKIDSNNLHPDVYIGMGHTRWATHGAKTDANSHPHFSNNKTFCVVHNGIINNYLEIKKLLVFNGYSFKSETDTEILANYLEYRYKAESGKGKDTIIKTIRKMQNTLTGTWGLLIYCKYDPSSLYLTRRGSPILVSTGKQEIHIASELAGLDKKAKDYKIIEEDDICRLSYGMELNQTTMTSDHEYRNHQISNNEEFLDSPKPFPHWTLKEIHEQPNVCLNAINHGGRILNDESVRLGGFIGHEDKLKDIDNIILLGCGSSYNAGLLSVKYFRELNDFNSIQVIDGSDFVLENIPKLGKTCLILISQSGETRDLHNVLLLLKPLKNLKCSTGRYITVGVVNVPNSLIAREVDFGCFTNAGREVGVASTKSYISQVIVLSMIAIFFSQSKNLNGKKRKKYIRDLKLLSENIKSSIDTSKDSVENITSIFQDKKSCFVTGQGFYESIAKEAALKIKEISYIHAEAYSCTSLKHGPFALLDENFPVIVINPKVIGDKNYKGYEKSKNSFEEIKSRKSPIIYISTENIDCQKVVSITLPVNNTYMELLCVIPCQLFAYYVSVKKGINPDFPRNLAKVVTV